VKRTHVVDLFSPLPGGSRQFSSPTAAPAWTEAQRGVQGNLQPVSGSISNDAGGQLVKGKWRGFFPASVTVEEGMGVKVTSGVGPTTYLVTAVGEQGAPWDTEASLDETAAVFE
jgi:hypothetical protein